MVPSSSLADPRGARGGLVVAELIHAGLPGDVQPHGLLVVDVDALSGRHVALEGGGDLQVLTIFVSFTGHSKSKALAYLLDLPRQHAALDTQHGGDIDVLPAHVVHPVGEALHRGLEEHPGELYDVEHSLDDVVCRTGSKI